MTLKHFYILQFLMRKKRSWFPNVFWAENGNPVWFKIKALSQEENEKITKRSTKLVKSKDGITEKLDAIEFGCRLVVSGTVEANFASQEICKAYGVLDPLSVLGKILLSGEFNRLLRGIHDLIEFLFWKCSVRSKKTDRRGRAVNVAWLLYICKSRIFTARDWSAIEKRKGSDDRIRPKRNLFMRKSQSLLRQSPIW